GVGGPQFEGRWFPHQRYRGIGPRPSGPRVWTGHPATHGRRRFSWVHIDDVIRAIRFIDTHSGLTGPINISSPGVTDHARLMTALRRAVRMPVGIPAPRWLLEIGMAVLRQESELVLKSRWGIPETLTAAGFDFRWTDIEAAAKSLLRWTRAARDRLGGGVHLCAAVCFGCGVLLDAVGAVGQEPSVRALGTAQILLAAGEIRAVGEFRSLRVTGDAVLDRFDVLAELDVHALVEDIEGTVPVAGGAEGLTVADDAAVELIDLFETAVLHQHGQDLAADSARA